MPVVMSLEGPPLAPWARFQDRAYMMLPKPFWRASAELHGVFDPVKAHPLLAVGGVLFGMWLAGSTKGRRLVRRARGLGNRY
jgi:hypothetical protein